MQVNGHKPPTEGGELVYHSTILFRVASGVRRSLSPGEGSCDKHDGARQLLDSLDSNSLTPSFTYL